MVDNFKDITELLEFRSADDFYFIQILQRKKDHKVNDVWFNANVVGSNNNSRLIKAYYVSSLDYLSLRQGEIIELCKLFNARAGINLNRRSYQKMALHHLKKITDQLINKTYNKAHKAYPSVVGAQHSETDKKWIIDIDDTDTVDLYMIGFLSLLQPEGNKFITSLKSKTGLHLITKPFNLEKFKLKYPDISVHRNNPTNLYIP